MGPRGARPFNPVSSANDSMNSIAKPKWKVCTHSVVMAAIQCGCMQESYAHDIIGDLSAGVEIGNRLFALIFSMNAKKRSFAKTGSGQTHNEH
jgi:hypothetical protein